MINGHLWGRRTASDPDTCPLIMTRPAPEQPAPVTHPMSAQVHR
jgi:hypothetical protein